VASAFVTGITGQDGSYLAELLRSKGYVVHGFKGDLADAEAVQSAVATAHPDECYHLGAQSFVLGEELPTFRVNTNGTLHVLEALRNRAPHCRLFLAGSAEMFGDADYSPQDESTVMRPRNVYGASKVAAYHLMRVYRRQYGLFACCGFLYNHESPRRGKQFVTRKITRAAARIKVGLENEVLLGDLEAIRDWGHARDYVRAMWLMLQHSTADDYVVATGEGRTVREFAATAFDVVGLDWRQHVRVDSKLVRRPESLPSVGSPLKAVRTLGWTREYTFQELVKEMVEADLAALTEKTA
jgi:GDPmannose 4,6-dehydratase